ncbi:MAG: DUF3267 domain-containing protein [Chloroflexi bacterium]|nr:DUF3267 domain-containing protein [Chloroflexota bacterium]
MRVPEGYVLAGDLFDDWQGKPLWFWLLSGNLLALLPLGAAITLLWLPYQFYVALGAPLALFAEPLWPGWVWGLAAALLLAASMLLHEALHGMALRRLGYRARLSYNSGYLYATVEAGQFLTRHHYLLMTLTPLALMSCGGGLVLPFLPPGWGQLWVLALLLNAAASIGDLVVARRTLRYPQSALFTDAAGIKVYVLAQRS